MSEPLEDRTYYHVIEIDLHNPVTLGIFITASFMDKEDVEPFLEVVNKKWYGNFGVDHSMAIIEGEL